MMCIGALIDPSALVTIMMRMSDNNDVHRCID
jgi:hypothetical protein